MPNLPVGKGIQSLPAGQIPDQWSAPWFSNFLVTWLALGDYRNAGSDGTVMTQNTGSGTPSTLGINDNSIGPEEVTQVAPNSLLGNPTGTTANYQDVALADLTGPPTAQVGLTQVTGSALTFLASDSAPELNQGISPNMTGDWEFSGKVGFGGTAPISPPTVTGSKGGNVALASLLTALASYGLIIDSST